MPILRPMKLPPKPSGPDIVETEPTMPSGPDLVEAVNACRGADAQGCGEIFARLMMRRGFSAVQVQGMMEDALKYIGRDGAFVDAAWNAAQRAAALLANVDDAFNLADEPPCGELPIVEGLIDEGDNVAVVASPKAGKSFLALQLAVCVAYGLPFLGHGTQRRVVLVENLEVKRGAYKARLEKMLDAYGLSRADGEGWLSVSNQKGTRTDWGEVRARAAFLGAQMVVIDPFYQIFDGEETNEKDVQAAIDEMQGLYRAGLTVVVVYHAPKGMNGDRRLIDMISGSSRLARFPEAVLGLLFHADDAEARVFQTVLRSKAPTDDMTLTLENGVFVARPDIGARVESTAARAKREARLSAAAAKSRQADERAQTMRARMADYLAERGADLPTRSMLEEQLAASGGRDAARDFVRARLDSGELATSRELYIDAGGETREKPTKLGGRTFVSTPDLVEKYKGRFNG